jgi:hypothetical protein
VTLTLPEGAGFALQAETTGGEISNDFGGTSPASGHSNSLTATVGSGHAKVSISTTHGDVAVRKGMASLTAPIPPLPPTAPTPPHAPAKPAKPGASVSF